jgi:hypothetical protein
MEDAFAMSVEQIKAEIRKLPTEDVEAILRFIVSNFSLMEPCETARLTPCADEDEMLDFIEVIGGELYAN